MCHKGRDVDGFPNGGVAVDPVRNPGGFVNVTAIYQLLADNDPKGQVVAKKNMGRIGQGYSEAAEIGDFMTESIPNSAGRYAIVFGGEISGAKVSNGVVCADKKERVHTSSCIQPRVPNAF
jgi:hypothetical protein